MNEFELQHRLHELFHPLIKRAVDLAHEMMREPILVKQECGWHSDLTRRLNLACQRFVKRFTELPPEWHAAKDQDERRQIEQATSRIPDLAPLFSRAGNLLCVGADLETGHFPRWLRWWVEDLEEAGILYYDGEEKRIKVKEG